MTSLKETGEFKLIDKIKKMFDAKCTSLKAGIGDDCAVIKKDNTTDWLVSTDLLIESVHFNLEYITPKLLGKKTAAVNISDIAAMGGRPKFILVSIAMPKKLDVSFVKDFFSGVKSVLNKYDTKLIGGDTSSSKKGVFISVTIMGEVRSGESLMRSNAKPCDLIYVTGTLGNSTGGLHILSKDLKIDESTKRYLVKKHLNVIPRVEKGDFLRTSKAVTSMIDLSDGIGSDIKRICEQSGVGAKIFSKSLPISKQLRILADSINKDPIDYALYGGEDYELLFTVNPDCEEKLKHDYKKMFKANIFKIGEVTTEQKITLISSSGNSTVLSCSYDHFLM